MILFSRKVTRPGRVVSMLVIAFLLVCQQIGEALRVASLPLAQQNNLFWLLYFSYAFRRVMLALLTCALPL